MSRKVPILAGLIFALLGVAVHVEAQSGASRFDPAWACWSAATITNPGVTTLTGYQARVADRSFDLAAKRAGSDLGVTSSDGTTLIPFCMETGNPTSNMASWMRVPSILATGTVVYLHYGDSAAVRASPALGYYSLASPQTALVQDQSWETAPPHTLSVVQVNSKGYTYWGYYGLADGGGVGLARSDDLVHWTKYSGNPLFLNGRWPSVLRVGRTFYMLYTKDFCATSYINLASSTDGITFTDLKTMVQPQSGIRNQNPNLFYNPNDGKYYIHWYRGDETTTWDIRARTAANITDLDKTASEVMVVHSTSRLAAPNILYYNNTYFLSTEVKDSGNQWNVRIYASTSSPTSGFYKLPGNPVLANDSACLFQHVFGTTLHGYYCKRTNSTWTVEHRAADLAAGRLRFQILDPGRRTIVMLLAIGLVLAFLIFLVLRTRGNS